MVEEVLAKVESEIEGEKQRATADYNALVELLADGTEPKPGRVRDVLKEAGRSLDDLRNDVTLVVEQRRDAAHVLGLQPLFDRAEKATAEIAEADRELSKAQERHAAIVGPAQAAIEAAAQARHDLKFRASAAERILKAQAATGRFGVTMVNGRSVGGG